MTVYGDSRLRPVRFSRIPRPDVAKALSNPALAYSGFELVFAPPAGGAGDLGAPICMVAAGTSNGVPALIVEDTGPCQPGARPVAVGPLSGVFLAPDNADLAIIRRLQRAAAGTAPVRFPMLKLIRR